MLGVLKMNICMPGIECLVQNCCNFALYLIEKNIFFPILILMIILLIVLFIFMFRNGE